MTYERLAYDDQDSADQMRDDCHACGSSITLPRQAHKPEIEVTEAAAHLAARLHLHLD